MTANKIVKVEYYAVFREQRGIGEESITTTASTPAELYTELKLAHGFSLPIERLKVAVNDEFVEWNSELASGSNIVFIPPVAGG